MERKLTITTRSDWKAALRAAGSTASKGVLGDRYQGEVLNFETPDVFFSHLTSNRWAMLAALQGAGRTGVRELARQLGRDVKRVHEDAAALVALGLLEKTETGALICPYEDIHIDMRMVGKKAA